MKISSLKEGNQDEHLEQCWPPELSVVMETFYVCPVQYGSQWPCVVLSIGNVFSVTRELNF